MAALAYAVAHMTQQVITEASGWASSSAACSAAKACQAATLSG